jgi:hypothetical protein
MRWSTIEDSLDRIEMFSVAGTLAGLLALAAALFIHRTAPDPRVATRFAALLILETLMVWTSRTGPLFWLEPAGLDRFWLRVHFANDGFLLATYLPALAVLIRSKLLAPFESVRWMRVMLGLAAINALCVFAFPDLYLGGVGPIRNPREMATSIGPGCVALFALLVLSYAFGLIATLVARQAAHGPLARRQATMLALAFGARDASWGVVYSIGLAGALFGASGVIVSLPWLFSALTAFGLILYVVLTAYGVASANLFDIDLKVKWTLERGTIAAIFIAVFFVVSEGAASFLSQQLGSLVGILATGALVFALAPLQRAVERFANQAMPSVQDTPEYKAYRKLQIYGEAVAEAMREGGVSPIQRVVLNRLRVQLGLDDQDALAFERELGPSTEEADRR